MHARSALFDLYGDHLIARGGHAPVSALIRILTPLGISSAATRTAISRMVAQGWLRPADTEIGPGYGVTERARIRLDEASARIYRTGVQAAAWDGLWHLRILAPIQDRSRRERVRGQLRFLGMAPISDSTWVSPHRSGEVDALLAEEGLRPVTLSTADIGPSATLLAAFDVDGLGSAYAAWHDDRAAELATIEPGADDRADFVVRSELLHSWRKFLFRDPGLPTALLPPDWPGHAAAAFFDSHATRLLPGASRFIDHCLDPSGEPT